MSFPTDDTERRRWLNKQLAEQGKKRRPVDHNGRPITPQPQTTEEPQQ